MDGHEHPGLSDDALERDIEAALGVEPSPEFLPRVRTRIASERNDAGWGWFRSSHWVAAGAAAIAMAILGVWMLRQPTPALQDSRMANSSEREVANVEPEQRAAAPESRIPNREPRIPNPGTSLSASVATPRPARTVQHPAVAEPEVLISQDEAAALRQLFAAISNRRLATSLLPDLDSSLEPPDEIEAIVLEPLELRPLASLESE